MESYSFAINTRPQCVWDWRLKEKNLEFLAGIDPDYFLYVADVNGAILATRKDQRAALAVRLAYSQALETFMALSAATIQASSCPMGWMLRYNNEDLREIIAKISQGTVEHCRFPASSDWNGLAAAVVELSSVPVVEQPEVVSCFAKMWSRLADDFLDGAQENEYNSLKHGMRARPGGFSLRIGAEIIPGEPAPAEAMKLLGASEYGSTFFVIEKPVGGKIDFRPRTFSRNWSPENLFSSLQLLAVSIDNVRSYLRARGGDTSSLPFRRPEDPAVYESPWAHHVGVFTCNFDLEVRSEHICQTTKEEVLDEIKRSPGPQNTGAPSA